MAEKETTSQNGSKNRLKKHLKWFAMAGIFALILGAAYWWFFKHNRVSTDDAYARADTAQVSSRVPGTVLDLVVDNDDAVGRGQVLLRLDPADYRVAVEKEGALLSQTEAEIKAAEVLIPQTDVKTAALVQRAMADLRGAYDKERETRHRLGELQSKKMEAEALLAEAEKDFSRYEQLYRQQMATEQRRDRARTALKTAGAQKGAVDQQISALKATLAAVGQQIDVAQAGLKSAQSERDNVDIQRHNLAALKAKRGRYKAELDAAELNLSYCTIASPVDGYIAQRWIQVGDRVSPGQALMAVVPLQAIYAEANYKETELTHVRLGQPAEITADIYPDHTYHGKVVGIRAGTGAAFSLLPPENATGNWIKVVQRVPVKIAFDEPPPPDRPLLVGLSLEVTIDTSKRSGRTLRPPPSTPIGSPSP
jgi:membrane fusion protein (multidrug efflux system)